MNISLRKITYSLKFPFRKHFSTIFDKIISKEIPSEIVFEDQEVLAFKDINPQYPIHVLVIPKVKDGLSSLANAKEENCQILGKLLIATRKVAEIMKIKESGYRVVINSGEDAGQTVDHIHLHVVGGVRIGWPPGIANKSKLKRI